MSILSWFLPPTDIPPGPSSGGSGLSFVPGGRALALLGLSPGAITGGKDRLIDPTTKDYVRTANGEWAETADSRTSMLIQLSVEVGASAFDPEHGTAIPARMRDGSLVEPEFVQAETIRAGGLLVDAGVISDLRVAVRDENDAPLLDESGRFVCKTSWTDLASGSPINSAFSPR